MVAALRKHLATIAVAAVTAATVAGGPAFAHAVRSALDADTVDGFHAVGCSASTTNRAGKLVATCSNGKLPNNIIAKAPDANKLDGIDSTGFLPVDGKAADSDKLDGIDSSGFIHGSGSIGHNEFPLNGSDTSEPIIVSSPLAAIHGVCSTGSGAKMYLDGSTSGSAVWFNKDGTDSKTFHDGDQIDITNTTTTPYLVVVQATDGNGQVATYVVAMRYGSIADVCTFTGQVVST